MLARALLVVVAASACEKTTHENIDKWKRTEKGAAKLASALSDESIDPDLSAHAGANLVEKRLDGELRAGIAAMSAPRRAAVIGKLAPRLWDIARVESDDAIPGDISVAAKDALFALRAYADDAARAQIDAYLIDWLAVPSYVGRARRGSASGEVVLRAIGAPAGKRMVELARSITSAVAVKRPDGKLAINRVDDELLLGVAVTQDPDAVAFVLELAVAARGDDTLATRALEALHTAYVAPRELFAVAPPAALVPNVDRLAAIAADARTPARAANDAIALVRAIGPPTCVTAFVALIPHPHPNAQWKLVVAAAAVACGGAPAITAVARALPRGAYRASDLRAYVVDEIVNVVPRDAALGALRDLLGEASPIARWVAIEALAACGSTDDAGRIAALGRAPDRLVGYWGDPRKPEPTLGQRATELAAQLANSAK